ncbi:MAG: YIP1 family protein [Candidatus Neomarinimicrobiota bacterium]
MNENVQKSIFGKITATFWEPSVTFRALQVKSGWLDIVVPLILIVLVSLASTPYVTPLALDEQKARIEKSERLSDEQKTVAIERIDNQKDSIRLYIMGPVFLVLRTVVVAAVLIFIGNFLLGGEVKYKTSLAITAYASLVDIVASAVKVPLILAQQTIQVYTGPAIFLQDDSTFLFRLFTNLDIFVFWKVVIISIGIGIVAKKKTNKAFWAVFACWLVYCLVVAGLSGLVKI